MNTYVVTPIHGQPDWKSIPALAVDNILWLPDVGIRMIQQVCYCGGQYSGGAYGCIGSGL